MCMRSKGQSIVNKGKRRDEIKYQSFRNNNINLVTTIMIIIINKKITVIIITVI